MGNCCGKDKKSEEEEVHQLNPVPEIKQPGGMRIGQGTGGGQRPAAFRRTSVSTKDQSTQTAKGKWVPKPNALMVKENVEESSKEPSKDEHSPTTESVDQPGTDDRDGADQGAQEPHDADPEKDLEEYKDELKENPEAQADEEDKEEGTAQEGSPNMKPEALMVEGEGPNDGNTADPQEDLKKYKEEMESLPDEEKSFDRQATEPSNGEVGTEHKVDAPSGQDAEDVEGQKHEEDTTNQQAQSQGANGHPQVTKSLPTQHWQTKNVYGVRPQKFYMKRSEATPVIDGPSLDATPMKGSSKGVVTSKGKSMRNRNQKDSQTSISNMCDCLDITSPLGQSFAQGYKDGHDLGCSCTTDMSSNKGNSCSKVIPNGTCSCSPSGRQTIKYPDENAVSTVTNTIDGKAPPASKLVREDYSWSTKVEKCLRDMDVMNCGIADKIC